jgi:hypothetical protein
LTSEPLRVGVHWNRSRTVLQAQISSGRAAATPGGTQHEQEQHARRHMPPQLSENLLHYLTMAEGGSEAAIDARRKPRRPPTPGFACMLQFCACPGHSRCIDVIHRSAHRSSPDDTLQAQPVNLHCCIITTQCISTVQALRIRWLLPSPQT